MKNVKFIVAIALMMIVVAGCSDDEKKGEGKKLQPPVQVSLTQTESVIVKSQNAFGFKLLNTLVEKTDVASFAVSPYGALQVLSMLVNGADGETAMEIASLSGLTSAEMDDINGYYKKINDCIMQTDPTAKVDVVNGLWTNPEKSFGDDFLNKSKQYFLQGRNCVIETFKTYEEIKEYYSSNMSKEVASAVTKQLSTYSGDFDKMAVNSTLCFDGKWETPFNKSKTKKENFYGEKGEKQVAMMKNAWQYPYYKGEDYAMLELPYGNGAFSMVIALPDEGVSLKSVAEKFKSLDLNQLHSIKRDVVLSLPQFKNAVDVDLLKVYRQMSWQKITSDYPGISMDGSVKLDEMKQFVSVDVNESGTKIESSTTGILGDVALKPEIFEVNRPFIWFVKENSTNAVLFLGKVGEI